MGVLASLDYGKVAKRISGKQSGRAERVVPHRRLEVIPDDEVIVDTDDIVCVVCGEGDDPAFLLLCDCCDAGYHSYCLSPPRADLPEDSWFCPECLLYPEMASFPREESEVLIGRPPGRASFLGIGADSQDQARVLGQASSSAALFVEQTPSESGRDDEATPQGDYVPLSSSLLPDTTQEPEERGKLDNSVAPMREGKMNGDAIPSDGSQLIVPQEEDVPTFKRLRRYRERHS